MAACGAGSSDSHHSATSPATAPAASSSIAIPPSDRQACADLFARLQVATSAVSASSELLTNSQNQQQLATQIQVEAQQLSRAGDVLSQSSGPAALNTVTEDLVGALRAFSADFQRAQTPASKGDFQGAVEAMTDRAIVNRIVADASTIEASCK